MKTTHTLTHTCGSTLVMQRVKLGKKAKEKKKIF